VLNYLTGRQSEIWGLARSGFSEVEISKKLEISRQATHIMLHAARSKIVEALTSTAQATRIQMRHMDVEKGILLGYSPELNHKVVITYSPKNGVRIWYAHEKGCEQCNFDKSWVSLILDEAEERGVKLSRAELQLPPPQLAKTIFQKMLPGVEL
jgi:hypothetical protein